MDAALKYWSQNEPRVPEQSQEMCVSLDNRGAKFNWQPLPCQKVKNFICEFERTSVIQGEKCIIGSEERTIAEFESSTGIEDTHCNLTDSRFSKPKDC